MKYTFLQLKCYIDIILKKNKTVEYKVAKSYDNIHNTFIVSCEHSSKNYLNIQAAIECGFNVKRVRNIIRTYCHEKHY